MKIFKYLLYHYNAMITKFSMVTKTNRYYNLVKTDNNIEIEINSRIYTFDKDLLKTIYEVFELG